MFLASRSCPDRQPTRHADGADVNLLESDVVAGRGPHPGAVEDESPDVAQAR